MTKSGGISKNQLGASFSSFYSKPAVVQGKGERLLLWSTMGSPRREDERSMAFDLLGSGSDGEGGGFTKRLRRSYSYSSSPAQTGETPPMRQRLLRAIHQELSTLAAEADGVSEKVKVRVGWGVDKFVGR